MNHDSRTPTLTARDCMRIQAEAIAAAAESLDSSFAAAVDLLFCHPGKIVVTGVGKSGYVAQKIAATLCSVGTQAVFLHPGDAVHGDLGVYSPGDPTILISKGGATAELLRLIPVLRRFHSPLIGICGNMSSPLAHQADVVLDATVTREADPLGIVPTASTSVALALGDALACALMVARGFTEQDFAKFHPGGQLGRNLSLQVADVMHHNDEVAWVGPDMSLREVVIAMTHHPLGAACVVDERRHLLGLVTDGDLRRALQRLSSIERVTARDVMTPTPITVFPGLSLNDAVKLMEDRPSQISVLPVVDASSGACLGLLRLHDIYQPALQ